MTTALIFPGQGSQQPGMGKALYDRYSQSKAVFDEVDEALGEALSKTIFEGPEDQLTLTANAQPALMAVSMAVMKALESEGFSLAESASHVAGHSLGEYSALCAAGSISIADTARLLRIRGNAMQAAVPVGQGAMAAIIGLEQGDVEAICDSARGSGTCQIANDNGGGQLVISGSKAEVEAAAAGFVAWMGEIEQAREWYTRTYAIPANATLQAEGLDYASAGASEGVANGLQAFTAMAAVAAEQTPQAYQLQGSPIGFKIYNATVEYLSAAMIGDLTVDEALDKIREAVK